MQRLSHRLTRPARSARSGSPSARNPTRWTRPPSTRSSAEGTGSSSKGSAVAALPARSLQARRQDRCRHGRVLGTRSSFCGRARRRGGAKFGIRVNALAPGYILTDVSRVLLESPIAYQAKQPLSPKRERPLDSRTDGRQATAAIRGFGLAPTSSVGGDPLLRPGPRDPTP